MTPALPQSGLTLQRASNMKSIIIYIVLLVALFPQAAFSEKLIHLKSMRQMQSEKINKQTFDYSCGAASLAILFRYYFNDDIDEKTILADIVYRLDKNAIEDRARNGFSMLDLKLSAERLGYVADGVKLSLDSVKRLKGPIIILLKTDKENHFVVLKGVPIIARLSLIRYVEISACLSAS